MSNGGSADAVEPSPSGQPSHAVRTRRAAWAWQSAAGLALPAGLARHGRPLNRRTDHGQRFGSQQRVLGLRFPLHDGARSGRDRPDACHHAGRNRPFDSRRDVPRRQSRPRRLAPRRQPARPRHPRLHRPRPARRAGQRSLGRDLAAQPAHRHARRRDDRARVRNSIRAERLLRVHNPSGAQVLGF